MDAGVSFDQLEFETVGHYLLGIQVTFTHTCSPTKAQSILSPVLG